MIDFLETAINPFAWVLGNFIIAYIALALIVFTTGYYALFDPSTTTAGKMIFRFFVSLLGLIVLIFVGTYVDPAGDRTILELPSDVEWWRPAFRAVVYGYLAFTITSLGKLLVLRKWYPQKLKTAPDLVKPRHDTNETQIVNDYD